MNIRILLIECRYFTSELMIKDNIVHKTQQKAIQFMVQNKWTLAQLLFYAQRRGWRVTDLVGGEDLMTPRKERVKTKHKRKVRPFT